MAARAFPWLYRGSARYCRVVVPAGFRRLLGCRTLKIPLGSDAAKARREVAPSASLIQRPRIAVLPFEKLAEAVDTLLARMAPPMRNTRITRRRALLR
jgi:hypothetical protein